MRPQDGPGTAAVQPPPDKPQPVQPQPDKFQSDKPQPDKFQLDKPQPDKSQPEPAEPAVQIRCPQDNSRLTGELSALPARDTPPLSLELDLRLAAMEAALAEVAQQLGEANARALARERVIDRQHAEIERLRSAVRAGQLRPVVTDLGRLRNGLLRQAGTVPAEMTGPQVATLLESFAATVEDMLERCGVAVLPGEVGAAFAPSRQQVAAVVEIDDPERDGTVAEVVQDGYAEIDGGRVVIPARIRLHRYVPTAGGAGHQATAGQAGHQTKEKTDG
ncbi:MAG: nucleotide exchange factor GrpE [Pseudonocardiales bacterium]|nr:nucleotide exchange factor GrpE [Pseudonocardiales bacterium]